MDLHLGLGKLLSPTQPVGPIPQWRRHADADEAHGLVPSSRPRPLGPCPVSFYYGRFLSVRLLNSQHRQSAHVPSRGLRRHHTKTWSLPSFQSAASFQLKEKRLNQVMICFLIQMYTSGLGLCLPFLPLVFQICKAGACSA